MAEIRPKGYHIKKRIDKPAKIVGLYYNTFFVFVILAAFLFMIGSSKGIVGVGISVLLILVSYLGLFFVQTKIGPKELKKIINNYQNPINYIKINRSIRR